MAAPTLQTLRVIHLSFLLTPLVLYGVLQITPLEAQGDSRQLAQILGLVALAQVPLIPVLRKVTMGAVALGGADVAPGASQIDQGALDRAIAGARQRYQTGTIVGCAVAESIALLGFVAAFLTAAPSFALPFLAGSMALLAVQLPREQSLLSLIDAPLRAAAQRRLHDKLM